MNNKFAQSLAFGSVIADSCGLIENCELPVMFTRMGPDGKIESHTVNVKIVDKTDVGTAVNQALSESKSKFLELNPDAALEEYSSN